MYLSARFLSLAIAAWLAPLAGLWAEAPEAAPPSPPADEAPSGADPVVEVDWLTDYGHAMRLAEEQHRMLLIFFACPEGGVAEDPGVCHRLEAETLGDARVCRRLQDYVCVRVPLDQKIVCQGKETRLLQHPAYREMLGRPGVAIVDFANRDESLRGAVVSTFPITHKLWYTPEKMAVILDLPPGTLTQRTLIYAVRTHPDKPASAEGQLDANLLEEASGHSQYQARVRFQGHQQWNRRFQRITARLPAGLTAREVCAESWPGEPLVEAAVECVRCWRLSSGHWSAVRARQRLYGYDMKRGRNGIWYATGIFGGQ